MDEINYANHFEEIAQINSTPEKIFYFADNHDNFSSHMNKSSLMMAGSKMETIIDEGKGQVLGSHIIMKGKVLGINIYLDEIISRREPPFKKEWHTVGNLNLIVIDHYRLGFEIIFENGFSKFKVFIDYNLPKSPTGKLIGMLFGKMYAKWCVRQMSSGVINHFK